MKKEPRYYQLEAYSAIVDSLKIGHVPYVDMCPGSGKSLLLAMVSNSALLKKSRVLMLVPRKELVEQNYKELFGYTDFKKDIGICCGKLLKHQIDKKITIATYTSFLSRRYKAAAFDVLLVDECHNLSNDPNTSYQKIITACLLKNPKLKIIGCSGTPYREGQGVLENDCLKGKATFTHCAYTVDVKRLISEGYLSHVESISGDIEIDLDGVKLSGKDYNTEQMGVKFDAICQDAVADMRLKFNLHNIKTALIFASTIANAERIKFEFGSESIRIVHGGTSTHDRNHAIEWLKNGPGKRYIVNVAIYTTGFDYPGLDCVVLMRATASYALYKQMVTRVIRAHADKEKGYLIDYGTNLERHGPIDESNPPKPKLKKGDMPKKKCTAIYNGDECGHENILSAKKCAKCEALFISEGDDGKYSMRTRAQVLSDKAAAKIVTHTVGNILWERYIANSGNILLKAIFYDIDDSLITTKYFSLNRAEDTATIMNLFKSRSDYFELEDAPGGVNIENTYQLLTEYPELFNRVKTITTEPDGRWLKIKNWGIE